MENAVNLSEDSSKLKLFFDDTSELGAYCEVFLNIDPTLKTASLNEKDQDYRPNFVRAFSNHDSRRVPSVFHVFAAIGELECSSSGDEPSKWMPDHKSAAAGGCRRRPGMVDRALITPCWPPWNSAAGGPAEPRPTTRRARQSL